MTHETIREAMNTEVVDRIDGVDVLRSEFEGAFNRVADKENWKNPISACVEIADGHELEVILRAIAFFTGSMGTACPRGRTRSDGRTPYLITAPGYYAAVGA